MKLNSSQTAGAGLFLSLALLAGCIGGGQAPETAPVREPLPADVGIRVREFVHHGFGFRFGKTVAEIRKNLGKPLSTSEREVANLHYPDRTDLIRELEYPGLSSTVYRVTEDRKEIVTGVTITGSRYKLRWGLKVGSSIADITTVLGPPTEETAGMATWVAGEEAPSSVSFYFRNGTVYKIVWNFYID